MKPRIRQIRSKTLVIKLTRQAVSSRTIFSANLAVEGLKAIANAAKEAAESCAQVGIDLFKFYVQCGGDNGHDRRAGQHRR